MKRIAYKLTISESKAFNAFAEERVLALKSITPKISINPEQLEHARACFFNAIADAYACGLTTKNRKNKPNGIGIRFVLNDITLLTKQLIEKQACMKIPTKAINRLHDRVAILSKQYLKARKP